jgi:hypothetical protein
VSGKLRPIAEPFVVAPPTGARVRTRLPVSGEDEAVLQALGPHLSALAGADLAWRCLLGRIPTKDNQRTQRKRAPTAACSSRRAGTITRASEVPPPVLRLRRIRVLWSPSWFVATVGGALLEVVRRYVEHQKAAA